MKTITRRYLNTKGRLNKIAMALTLAGVISHSTMAVAASGGTSVAVSIAPGKLSDVLLSFAKQADVPFSFDPSQLGDTRSQGLTGSYTVQQGFERLLAGTGFTVVKLDNGGYAIEKQVVSTASLDPVEIGGTALDADTEDTGSYIVSAVTVGKSEKTLRETPQSVSVITRKQLDDQHLNSVTDALRQVTGVNVNAYGDGTAGYTSRGYTLHAEYDGVPSSSGLQRSPQFDLAMYDRIEVLRGPTGLLDGQGEPGGTVNFVRKRPTEENQLLLNTSFGSYGSKYANVDVSGAFNEQKSWRGRAVISGEDKHYAVSGQDRQQYMAYGITETDLSRDTTLAFSGTVQRMEIQRFMGIPTDSSGSVIASSPSSFFGAEGGHSDFPMYELMSEVTHYFGDSGWSSHLALRERKTTTDLLYGYVSSQVSSSNTARITMLRSNYDEKNRGLDLHLDGDFDLFGRTHTVVVGTNIDHYDYQGGSASKSLTGQSIYNTSYDLESVAAVTSISARRERQWGLYGKVDFKVLDPVTLTLGARSTTYNYQTRSVSSNTDWTSYGDVQHQISPYAGVVWELSDQHSLYASYTDIFVPQDYYKDADGNSLDNRVGWQIETGLKSEWFAGRLNTTAALYRLQDKNRAISDDTCTSSDYYDCWKAAGVIRSQGVELEAIGRASDNLDLSAGYTFNDNEYLVDSDTSLIGSRFDTTTPRHLLKLWAQYKFGQQLEGLSLGTGLRTQSKTYRNGSNYKLYQGSFSVVDLNLGYKLTSYSDVTLSVKNLLDKTYFERLGNSWGYTYYGEPRTVTLSWNAKF